MKKQLIMAAVGLALASGIAATSASAAPLSAGIGASEKSTSLAEKTHYRRHYHSHRRWGHRHWRPRMFGYLKHRHHHRRHYRHY